MKPGSSVASLFFFSSRRRHTRFDLTGFRRVLFRSPRLERRARTPIGPVRPLAFLLPCRAPRSRSPFPRSEEHTSELQSQSNLVCRLLLEKKKKEKNTLSHSLHHYNNDTIIPLFYSI